jgi:hypothetical protein
VRARHSGNLLPELRRWLHRALVMHHVRVVPRAPAAVTPHLRTGASFLNRTNRTNFDIFLHTQDDVEDGGLVGRRGRLEERLGRCEARRHEDHRLGRKRRDCGQRCPSPAATGRARKASHPAFKPRRPVCLPAAGKPRERPCTAGRDTDEARGREVRTGRCDAEPHPHRGIPRSGAGVLPNSAPVHGICIGGMRSLAPRCRQVEPAWDSGRM